MLFSEFCFCKSIQQSFLPTSSSCNGCLCLQDMHIENVDSEWFEACTVLLSNLEIFILVLAIVDLFSHAHAVH